MRPSGVGREVYMDTEGDGLLKANATGTIKQMTRFWCLGGIDTATEEYFYFGPRVEGYREPSGSIEDGVRFFEECDTLIGHNALDYDYRALERYAPGGFKRPRRPWDSLVVAKVIWPPDVLIGPDLQRIREGKMPAHLLKRHSLEAWGYRTGDHKEGYTGGFDAFHPDMPPYMEQDCRAGLTLWKLCKKRLGWDNPEPGQIVWPELTLEYEHEVQRIILDQEEDGVRFDEHGARELVAHLQNEQERIGDRLREIFGSWWAPLDDPETGHTQTRTVNRKLIDFPDVTVPRIGKTGKPLAPYVGPPLENISEGSVFVRVERVTFNPSSRDHLGQRLQAVYGWKPRAVGKNGKPTVDESVLRDIPESVMPADVRQAIMDYFVVAKTLGTLALGQKSWLRMSGGTGRIHGQMDTCGAVTRRGTHKNPNLSGVPAVDKKDGKVLMGLEGRYAFECKSLFTADDGWEFTDVDASSLELIDLGHYLHPLDGGTFSARVCDPERDPHQEHADLASLQRADAKTAIYLFVYGGSAYKLSLDPALQVTVEEIPSQLGYKGLSQLLANLKKRLGVDYVEPDDVGKAKLAKARKIILSFEKNIEGLKDLLESVKQAAERGWLKAIDGSKIWVRKAHAALNSLLQSAGAITCKIWMMLVHRRLAELGLKRGVDFKQVLWVHDALSFTHRPGLGPIILGVCQDAIRATGVILGLRGAYRASGKTGHSWAECH